MIRMARKSVILMLLLTLVFRIDEVKSEKNNEDSLFTKLRTITSTAMDVYRVLERIINRQEDVNTLLNELVDWLADDDTHELDGINNKLTDASSQLHWIMMRMEVKFVTIENMISHLPLTIETNSIKRDLAMTIRRIKDLYDEALSCSSDIHKHNRVELQNLAKTLTGRQAGDLRESLSKLYNHIVPETAQNLKGSFLDLLNHQVQAKGDMLCGDIQSPNLYLYQLHKLVVTTEMIGQVALTFGYYLQHELNNVDIDFELQRAQKQQFRRLKNYFRKFKTSMENSSLSLRPCDPANLKRGETFIEMEGLYQVVVVGDYGMNREDSCRGTCDTINVYEHQYDKHGILCTHLHKCWAQDISRYCVRPDELRRYEWIEEPNGFINGEKNGCQGRKVESRSWTKNFFECENCICTCEGGHEGRMEKEVQAFSLRSSRSNTAENMVVTGIKFLRLKSIICIQIKQGKLLPGGGIDGNSEKWTQCDFSYPTYTRARNGTSEYVEGKDFVVLNSTYNYIDLDAIVGEKDTILTGVKFGLSDSCTEGKHIKLQLEYTKFNFSSGVLNAPEKTRSSSTCHTEKISIADTDSPLNQKESRDQNTVDSRSNSYVRFGWSSFKRDVGQTTLPLLDAQPVESKPSAPLSGAGLFYKASPGYGGFLAFKIHSLNYGKYMEEDMIEDLLDEDPDDHEVDTTSEEHGNLRKKLFPGLNRGATDDTVHALVQQSKEVGDNSPSYSLYIMLLVVIFSVFLCLYILRTYREWFDNHIFHHFQ